MVRTTFYVILFLLWGSSWSLGAVNPMPNAAPPGEVIPDTLRAVLILPEDMVQPVSLSVLPDTVDFGGIAQVVLDFPPGSVPDSEFIFSLDQDWVVPAEPGAAKDAREIAKLPTATGPRVVLPIRVYRNWPFRISGGTGISRVIHVRGKVENMQDMAPVRTPRLWGMDLTQLVFAGLLLLALVLLFWWYWSRRKALVAVMDGLSQDPVAWVETAVRLAELQQHAFLEKGQTREFLSQLASITRAYVAGRFLVGAEEMTGREIEETCLAQGYEVSAVRPFAMLLRRVDQLRYNPELPQPALCREEFASLVDMIKAARIVPEHTSVPAADLIAAGQAWSQVSQFGHGEKGGSYA